MSHGRQRHTRILIFYEWPHILQVDYNEKKSRGSATKLQAAALRQRAAAAVLNLGSAPPPAAIPGPWLDLTPGARFSPTVRCRLLAREGGSQP